MNNHHITLVITSCGRLELLRRTIASIRKFYCFNKDQFIIIEDSANKKVAEELTGEFGEIATLIINEKKLGLLKSVDKAYKEVTTQYIFHCEDDWVFYRPGFIEESIAMLEANSKLKQVNLRSIHHDYLVHHQIDIEPERIFIAGHACYKIKIPNNIDKSRIPTSYPLEELDWSSFSFNPGIVRKNDYNLIGSYQSIAASEAEISTWYKRKGFYMVALENDAVLHIGWGHSLEGNDPEKYNFKKRLKNLIKAAMNIFGSNWSYERG